MHGVRDLPEVVFYWEDIPEVELDNEEIKTLIEIAEKEFKEYVKDVMYKKGYTFISADDLQRYKEAEEIGNVNSDRDEDGFQDD